ncbi:ABC transporter ATP-binding protein [Paenibacillus sp. JCM 10914]
MDGGRVVLDGPPEALLRRCGEQLAQLGLLPRPAGEAAAPKPPAAPALLEVRSLSYRYPGGREVLRDIDAALYPGQLTLLTGENGSGKTTLSRLIVGLLPAPAARIYFQGEDVQRLPVYRRAEQIGYVFQQPEYMFTSSNVWEELIYCLHGGISERQRAALTAEQQERAAMLLEVAGLSDRRSMSPYLLSYGEKRLLSIICQLILPRALYILDEPTSGMDYAGIDRVVHLCRIVMKEGAAVLMITHDPELMSPYANAFIHLRNGKSDCASYE